MILTRKYQFSASHILSNQGRHRCGRLHGHNYVLSVSIWGDRVDDEDSYAHGMVYHTDDLDVLVWSHFLCHVEHEHLNDLLENPTLENVAYLCLERLDPRIGIASITLSETDSFSVTVTPSDLD